MKLIAEKKLLTKAINLALLASGRGSKDAALSNVLIVSQHGQSTIESYDMHIFSRSSFPSVGEQGEFALDGSKLDNLINSADEGNVEFDVNVDGVRASFGHATINLRTFPTDKYVRMVPTGIRTTATGVRAQLLLTAIEFVRPFVGKDTQKPTQMNAELRHHRFLAGDGVRVGVVKCDHFDFNLKIPSSVIGNVTRWLKETSTGATEEEVRLIDVLETEDFYFFRTELQMIGWRKPEHEFMAVEGFLEKFEQEAQNNLLFKVDRESFQRMVASLAVVLESGAERIGFGINGAEQPMLVGTAQDSRGIDSQNQIQVIVDHRNGDAKFALRYTHLLETLKLTSNPVIKCDVRKDDTIFRILEEQPEMSKMALLTLMAEV